MKRINLWRRVEALEDARAAQASPQKPPWLILETEDDEQTFWAGQPEERQCTADDLPALEEKYQLCICHLCRDQPLEEDGEMDGATRDRADEEENSPCPDVLILMTYDDGMTFHEHGGAGRSYAAADLPGLREKYRLSIVPVPGDRQAATCSARAPSRASSN